jgi:hypothetical protein
MAHPRPQTHRRATGPGTAVVEQSARAPALLDPERLASGAGSLLRHSVHYAGQLAAISLAARRFNPKKATGASHIPPSPTPPHLLPHHAGLPRAVRRGGHHASRSPHAWKDKELLQFIANVVTSSSLAPTKCAAQQSGHAQTRLRKRRCEPGAGPAQLPALTRASTGGCPLRSSRAPCVSARTSQSLPARSSTATLCAR